MDAYSGSLIHTTPTPLSLGRNQLAAASVSDYTLFGGGESGRKAEVDAYTSLLVHTTPTPLSDMRGRLAAASAGGYALFGGGATNSSDREVMVDAYDADLIRTTPTQLNTGREYLAATSVGGYTLFGGGYENPSYSSVVDAFMFPPSATFTIPAWSVYKFDGFHDTEQITFHDIPWSNHGALTGYIRRTFTLSGEHPEVP